jgi:hypothetical protein
MGWRVIGRLPLAVRPTHLTGLVQIARARLPATRGALPTTAGTAATTVFSDRALATSLLALAEGGPGLTTRRTPEYLEWRYGPEALRYRVVTGPGGPGPRGRSRDLRDARPPG